MPRADEIIKLSNAMLNGQLEMSAAIKRQNELKTANEARLVEMQNQFLILLNFIEKQVEKIQDKPIDQNIITRFITALGQFIADNALPQDALNTSQSPYKSLLETCLDNQNFKAAHLLVESNAIVGPAEREAFKISINSEAGVEYGFPPAKAEGELHTVKKYGLVLGLEVNAKDGTFSQKSYLGPALSLVTSNVDTYAKTVPNDDQFQKIASAFKAAKTVARYKYSAPTNPNAGKTLLARAQQANNVTSIPIRCKGHTMGLSVITDKEGKGGYVAFTNRGVGSRPGETGTKLYKIDDVSKLDAKSIETVMSLHGDKNYDDVIKAVATLTDNKPPAHFIHQPPQTVDNCTVVNPTSNIEGMLVAMAALEADKEPSAVVNAASTKFATFNNAVESRYATELAAELQQNPHDTDLQNLATTYVEKYPNTSPELEKSLAVTIEQDCSPSISLGR